MPSSALKSSAVPPRSRTIGQFVRDEVTENATQPKF